MNDLFSSLGIIHQTSFAYSPHQNGVDERKHRHLLNVAKSLLFQRGIPLKMWTECILTVVHLINKFPSSVLIGKSPFELVYGLKPILSHLRNFGCLCFSYVLNNSDKFSASEDNFATSMGENTSSEGTVPSSGLNAQNLPKNISKVQPDVRRSGRNVKLPSRFNDYVVGSSMIYGLEKYVSYSNLSAPNFCFSTNLNKSSEPNSYYEALKDSR
ncbi:ribonuclease H-like domain-containing protein [Tanacetum coccineum]